jgi:hypothetical protein
MFYTNIKKVKISKYGALYGANHSNKFACIDAEEFGPQEVLVYISDSSQDVYYLTEDLSIKRGKSPTISHSFLENNFILSIAQEYLPKKSKRILFKHLMEGNIKL